MGRKCFQIKTTDRHDNYSETRTQKALQEITEIKPSENRVTRDDDRNPATPTGHNLTVEMRRGRSCRRGPRQQKHDAPASAETTNGKLDDMLPNASSNAKRRLEAEINSRMRKRSLSPIADLVVANNEKIRKARCR